MASSRSIHDFGIPGVHLEPGDHICAIFMGPAERDAIMLPYLRAGLRAGDKCICIVDSTGPEEVLAGIGDPSETETYVDSKQLELLTSDQAYLRSPEFSTDDMLDFWEDSMKAAVGPGRYPFARASGEMPWALRDLPARAEFFRYEAAVNAFATRYPQGFLCMYDLTLFGGGFLVDLLRTHPKLLLGGLVLENPHYIPPDQLVAPAV
jgi:hypothetical protein